MFYTNNRPLYGKAIKIFFPICFMLICIFFPFTPQLSAQGTHLLSNGPRIKKIDAGFGGMYRDGNWVPLQISLENNGPEFDGKIAVNLPPSLLADRIAAHNGISNSSLLDARHRHMYMQGKATNRLGLARS